MLKTHSCVVAMMPHALVCANFDGLEPMLLPDRRSDTFTVSLIHNTWNGTLTAWLGFPRRTDNISALLNCRDTPSEGNGVNQRR
jgi:hypothetical protein